MVVLFNDNAAEAQTFLRTNGLIMSNPPINNIVAQTNTTLPVVRNEWTQPSATTTTTTTNGVTNNKNEAACAALICRPNSHPFQVIYL